MWQPLGLFCLALINCDLAPLTSADLYGPRDSGLITTADAPSLDAVEASTSDANDADVPSDDDPKDVLPDAPHDCRQSSTGCVGPLSGTVVDGCNSQPMTGVVVGINGIVRQLRCTSENKGAYAFASLPTGTSLTLAAGKHGYQGWSMAIKLTEAGIANQTIVLLPASPYTCDNPPPGSECVCEAPPCI